MIQLYMRHHGFSVNSLLMRVANVLIGTTGPARLVQYRSELLIDSNILIVSIH